MIDKIIEKPKYWIQKKIIDSRKRREKIAMEKKIFRIYKYRMKKKKRKTHNGASAINNE